MKNTLTIETLLTEAALFSVAESIHDEPALFGVTDGKAVGTYLEHKFVAHLMEKYSFAGGNSASGIDIPSVDVHIKVTSIRKLAALLGRERDYVRFASGQVGVKKASSLSQLSLPLAG